MASFVALYVYAYLAQRICEPAIVLYPRRIILFSTNIASIFADFLKWIFHFYIDKTVVLEFWSMCTKMNHWKRHSPIFWNRIHWMHWWLLWYITLLIWRYNHFAVLAWLRSVRNRSRSRAFISQSVIPALMADASTPSCHLNLGLARLLCPCGRPKKTLRAGSSVSMRTTWPVHRSLASLILPIYKVIYKWCKFQRQISLFCMHW